MANHQLDCGKHPPPANSSYGLASGRRPEPPATRIVDKGLSCGWGKPCIPLTTTGDSYNNEGNSGVICVEWWKSEDEVATKVGSVFVT